MRSFSNLGEAIESSIAQLSIYGELVEPGHWQGTDVRDKPEMQPFELMNCIWTAPVVPRQVRDNPPLSHLVPGLRQQINPNLPWADYHFEERVGRVPSNPGDQYMNWPHWRGQEGFDAMDPENENTVISTSSGVKGAGFKFTHTYQERIWPRRAGWDEEQISAVREHELEHEGRATVSNFGIRYRYGDLDDVVNLLLRDPYTRQAYLPIFFPEDTGAHHGGRVPCTLGYQFMLRQGKLHCWYTIRSCDAIRHFRDDVYLACRLLLWVLRELQGTYEQYRARTDPPPMGAGRADSMWDHVRPGNLTFHAYSFHCFKGDLHALQS